MIEENAASVPAARAQLESATRALADSATSDDASTTAMLTALAFADQLTALAVGILGRVGPRLGAMHGLPTEIVLGLLGRRTRSDARMLALAAGVLDNMPSTAAAFARGELSWSQVRAIASAGLRLGVAERTQIDELVASRLPVASTEDPDELVAAVDDHVADLRSDLVRAREDRGIESAFLSLQPRMDGAGGSLYGEADTQSFAAIVAAVDAAAERPCSSEDPDAPTRAHQRMDGLVALCEGYLAGSSSAGGASTSTRPRPRFIATIDLDASGRARGHGKVLWGLWGRPGRLSALATEIAACDADLTRVIFKVAAPWRWQTPRQMFPRSFAPPSLPGT